MKEPSTEGHVWWGPYNRPYAPEKFNDLFNRLQGYLQGHDLFVQDVYAGADPAYRVPVRIITEKAWHSLFVRNMFVLPQSLEEYRRHVPEFTVIAAPGFQGFPPIDGTNAQTFIALSFDQKVCLIGNTEYAGEIKKSVFTVLNYLLPLDGVLSMHASANVGKEGDSALFFGLSGTGKTTLSADPNRSLIGDDEHGWSDEGVFNIEGGCYAKVIALSAQAEPEIYATTHRFGTILENVTVDATTRLPDWTDGSRTENTRCSYPLDHLPNADPTGVGPHPENIVFLSADAFRVLPPIARLTREQAMYYFINGYTSKLGGTEAGVKDPEPNFSPCFGQPFLPRPPKVYAQMLADKIAKHNANVWLLNTGWTGGKYGQGHRFKLAYTRAFVTAILNGTLAKAKFTPDAIFGLPLPDAVEGVPSDVLQPRNTWADKAAYDAMARKLSQGFRDNDKKFEMPDAVRAAGPRG